MSWRTAFLVSVAINLIVLGAAAGYWVNGGFDVREVVVAEAPSVAAPAAVLRELPPASRQEVRRALAQGWRDTQAERAAMRAARAETARLMAAEPYDAAAVQAALATQRAASERVAARLHARLAESVADLTPAQRNRLLAALRSRSGLDSLDAEETEEVAPEDALAPAPDVENRRERFREKMRERRERLRGD